MTSDVAIMLYESTKLDNAAVSYFGIFTNVGIRKDNGVVTYGRVLSNNAVLPYLYSLTVTYISVFYYGQPPTYANNSVFGLILLMPLLTAMVLLTFLETCLLSGQQ
jgi:hypothetical protein